ncbi:bacteriocin [Pseudomonas syringae]|uniref:bacteriocin n=1 Tax=Pseudomonas syringae TaxID=317 RepID=UPI0004249956|nr:bacteriocin [Pseudomonas syringae]
MNESVIIRELSNTEMSHISGGMTAGEGVAAIGVVAAATALAPVTAIGAVVILGGVAAAAAIDVGRTMAQ